MMSVAPRGIATGFVFLALNRSSGLLWVGYSSDPREAIRKLQTANSDELAMTLVLPGTEHTHRALTNKIAGCHVSNGWYDAKAVVGILFGLDVAREEHQP